MTSPPEKMESVREGVFFTSPPPLPRGRHSLTRAEILAIQRERLLIASTEVLNAGGLGAVTARAICARAGISLEAFYQCFDSKEECIFLAYDRFISVLLQKLSGSSGAGMDWDEYVELTISAYLDTLSEDLVVARAFQVEMDSMGSIARTKRREALVGLATFLMAKHVEFDPSAEGVLPLSAYVASVYGVRQLASDALDTGEASDMTMLRTEVAQWVARMFGTN